MIKHLCIKQKAARKLISGSWHCACGVITKTCLFSVQVWGDMENIPDQDQHPLNQKSVLLLSVLPVLSTYNTVYPTNTLHIPLLLLKNNA